MAKRKRTTNYLQNTTQKTNDRKHEPYQDPRFELRCSERVPSSCSTSVTRHGTLTTPVVYSNSSYLLNTDIPRTCPIYKT
jgi:hypothetical protein